MKKPDLKIDVRQVVKKRALDIKDFELFEKAPLMEEKDAIEKLRQIVYDDPTFPFEYSEQHQCVLILEEIKEFADGESEENNLDTQAELEFNKEYQHLEKTDFEYWEMA